MNTENSETAIVIFTRYFSREIKMNNGINKKIEGNILNHLKILGNSSDDKRTPLDIFFSEVVWNKAKLRRIDNEENYNDHQQSIKSNQDFWRIVKMLYNKKGNKIDENYNGEIYYYDNSNIFFYHHWLDKQLLVSDSTIIRDYVKAVIHQISLLRKEIGFWYIFMHAGDFVGNPKRNYAAISATDIDQLYFNIKKRLTLNNDYLIESFHHNLGDLLFDFVLNNDKLHLDISRERESKKDFDVISYVLSLIKETEIINRFYKLIDS